jgi:hypothetical protein
MSNISKPYNPKTDWGNEGFGSIVNTKTGQPVPGYRIGQPNKPAKVAKPMMPKAKMKKTVPTKKKKILTKGKYVTMQ